MHRGFSVAILGAVLTAQTAGARIIVNFDNFGPTDAILTPIPNGYAGFDWSFFNVKSAGESIDPQHDTGYGHGVTSGIDITYNAGGNEASFSVPHGQPFTLVSAELTGAWNDGLVVRVEGVDGDQVRFSKSVTVNTKKPTFATFNFTNITAVYFSSSGGTVHDPSNPLTGTQFVMDDLVLNKLSTVTPGDANVDGHVDLTDLSIALNDFGATTDLWNDGNFDGAVTVDLTDVSDVLNHFGAGSPSAAIEAPEARTAAVMGVGMVLLARGRGRHYHQRRISAAWCQKSSANLPARRARRSVVRGMMGQVWGWASKRSVQR